MIVVNTPTILDYTSIVEYILKHHIVWIAGRGHGIMTDQWKNFCIDTCINVNFENGTMGYCSRQFFIDIEFKILDVKQFYKEFKYKNVYRELI